MSSTTRRGWIAALAVAVLVAGFSLAVWVGWLVARRAAPKPAARPVPTMCGLVATPSVVRCPPDTDRPVIATWDDGTIATVRWRRDAWTLYVSGFSYAIPSVAPRDWRELEALQ